MVFHLGKYRKTRFPTGKNLEIQQNSGAGFHERSTSVLSERYSEEVTSMLRQPRACESICVENDDKPISQGTCWGI